jgi:hypothetical protein
MKHQKKKMPVYDYYFRFDHQTKLNLLLPLVFLLSSSLPSFQQIKKQVKNIN